MTTSLTAQGRTTSQIVQTMPVSQLLEIAQSAPTTAIVELHRRAKEEAQTPAEVAHLFKLAAQINKRLRNQQP